MRCTTTNREATLVAVSATEPDATMCGECRVRMTVAVDHGWRLRPTPTRDRGASYAEQDPVYRAAMRDSGHGALLR